MQARRDPPPRPLRTSRGGESPHVPPGKRRRGEVLRRRHDRDADGAARPRRHVCVDCDERTLCLRDPVFRWESRVLGRLHASCVRRAARQLCAARSRSFGRRVRIRPRFARHMLGRPESRLPTTDRGARERRAARSCVRWRLHGRDQDERSTGRLDRQRWARSGSFGTEAHAKRALSQGGGERHDRVRTPDGRQRHRLLGARSSPPRRSLVHRPPKRPHRRYLGRRQGRVPPAANGCRTGARKRLLRRRHRRTEPRKRSWRVRRCGQRAESRLRSGGRRGRPLLGKRCLRGSVRAGALAFVKTCGDRKWGNHEHELAEDGAPSIGPRWTTERAALWGGLRHHRWPRVPGNSSLAR